MSTVAPLAVFGEPQLHADGDLLALAFTPDGTLCSVEEPGVLRHWHAQTGQQTDWQALSDLETIWAFSRDGGVIASGSDDLTLWDGVSGTVLASITQPKESWVTALAFAPDSGFVATGHDDGIVRYWDSAGRQLVHEWKLHNMPVSALAVSPDGQRLAAAGEDKIITLFNLSTGRLLGRFSGHTDRIPQLAWHPGGEFLVSIGWDATARVWNVRRQQPVILLNNHAAQVTALAFSPDGNWLATADSSRAIHLWDFSAKKEVRVLQGPPSDIHLLTFSPDGTLLASSGEVMIHLWDVASGQVVAGAGPRALARNSLGISADGRRLVTNTGGSAARVWNVASKHMPLTLPADQPVHGVAVSGAGPVFVGAAENVLRFWDRDGNVLYDADGPEENITVVTAAPDGNFVASASSAGADVWLWRVKDGEPALIIPDPLHNCTVEALEFSADSRRLAVAGIDWLATGGSSGGISVWDLAQRCEIAAFAGGATSVAFHPDGQRLASTTTDQSICFWDLASQELLTELTGHEGAIACLAFSPDGQWLASGGADRTLRLWNMDGVEQALHDLDSQITSLAFSPDGRFLFIAHANTTCSQYDLADLLN